jgi:anti-anti-sigma factor
MGVKSSVTDAGKTLTIAVGGTFQFGVYREFREAYEAFTLSGADIRVDLTDATYMDSAALGILMLLREHAALHAQKIVIANAPPVIRRILDIASFEKLFSIV